MHAALRPEQLAPFEGRRDLTLEELVEAAEQLLAAVAPVQQRYKVTARPDVRTIRYYTSQGLLPKPVGYDGGRARYALSHLLRLLLIKKLQAEHHTLARIKQELAGKSDDDVRRGLVTAPPGAWAAPHGDTPPARPVAGESSAREPLLHDDDPQVAAAPLVEFTLSSGEDPLARLTFSPELLRDPTRRALLADRLRELATRLTQGETP